MLINPATAADWDRYVEFRDTVKPGTVPDVLARQGKVSVQPWTAAEKTNMEGYIQKVFDHAPGLFRVGSSQGPIPFYRINKVNSYGGYGALWLSYMNSNVVAHELTHVADAEHKIARSIEFRKLVEPRIKELKSVMLENGFSEPISPEAEKRTDLIYATGLPTFYAAATIQETLAEYVRASVMMPDFKPPAEIQAFLNERLFDATPEVDPSVAPYRQGKSARLNGDYKTAHDLLSRAIEYDENFAEAYIERGLTLVAGHQNQLAVGDFTKAIGLMSEYDWQLYIPYKERGAALVGLALAGMAEYDDSLADFLEAKRLSPNTTGLDASIDQVRKLMEMQKRLQTKTNAD